MLVMVWGLLMMVLGKHLMIVSQFLVLLIDEYPFMTELIGSGLTQKLPLLDA